MLLLSFAKVTVFAKDVLFATLEVADALFATLEEVADVLFATLEEVAAAELVLISLVVPEADGAGFLEPF